MLIYTQGQKFRMVQFSVAILEKRTQYKYLDIGQRNLSSLLRFFCLSIKIPPLLLGTSKTTTKTEHAEFFFSRLYNYALQIMQKRVSLICSLLSEYLTSKLNQLLQLCTACTAWSDSVIRSASVIKLVSVLFGKCTTLVVTRC